MPNLTDHSVFTHLLQIVIHLPYVLTLKPIRSTQFRIPSDTRARPHTYAHT